VNLAIALRWLLAHWRVVGAAVVILAATYGGYHYRDTKARAEIAGLEKRYAEEKARSAVAALDITKKQERVSEDADRSYQKRLADLRAAYERRMREQPVPAESPVPDAPGVPDAGASELDACRADILFLEFTAAEDALQLHELQQWVLKQRGLSKD
jgi:hypothetical protein